MPVKVDGYAWVLESATSPLVRQERTWSDPPDGFALLEVLGCGVCHTDLGFADGAVDTKQGTPIVLGHEISGRVIRVGSGAGEGLLGRRVLVPAVAPCGECPTCRRGRATACPSGRMPGNDADGGFASHCIVPLRGLMALDSDEGGPKDGRLGSAGLEAWEIAPLADAATTAYQALERCGLAQGDVAIFVGMGGVGGFGAQLARARGARVIAIDVDPSRLGAYEGMVDFAIDASGLEPRAVRKTVRGFIKEHGLRDAPVRVFETSGAPPGQVLAFTLLDRGGSLSVVGFTPEKIPLRFSNIMALDADIYGNWGCDPALYPAVVEPVLDGRVEVRPFIERHRLDDVNEVLDRLRRHELSRRAVLIPER